VPDTPFGGGEFGQFARATGIVVMARFCLQGVPDVHVLARRSGGEARLLDVFDITAAVPGWSAAVPQPVDQVARPRQRMTREDGTQRAIVFRRVCR